MSKKLNNTKLSEFKITSDHVLVKEIEVDDGEVVLGRQYEDKPEFGEVITVGKDVKEVKKGQIILFGKYASLKIRHLGEDYLLIKEFDVKGFI